MERYLFSKYSQELKRVGQLGSNSDKFLLGSQGNYTLQYIPFEHVNKNAKLVIVGITPGNTQISLAYKTGQKLLKANYPENEILIEIKKSGAFGGASMKPNLLKMLNHFSFNKLLGIDNIETLWGQNAYLLHSTSVVPHAAFKSGKMFAGSFDMVMKSPLLKECFLDCFIPSAKEMRSDALFVGLGPCPKDALEWCVSQGHLSRKQVLGSFCHPSGAGGSTTNYYLREVKKEQLKPKNPVLNRCDWLDEAYEQMLNSTKQLLSTL